MAKVSVPSQQDNLDDVELVKSAQRGDEAALEKLLRRYERHVYLWTRPYFIQGGDEDDLFQEGMIGLYKAIRDYQGGTATFWSFAKLCVIRSVISAIKGTTRQKHIPLNSYTSLYKPIYDTNGDRTLLEVLETSAATDPEFLVMHRELIRTAQTRIKEILSRFEFSVFRLYIKGLSYREMAQELNTTTKSVDNALCRIKQKIESIL
ncbi:MAG: RNA polymerase sporulation sigma factor SigH [Firmicutes bacterium]|nr:RNA polymerase sporulation sigma factor SigH [Bacillota bacterium]